MERLYKKISQLNDLLKAFKGTGQFKPSIKAPKMPTIQMPASPAVPKINTSLTKMPAIAPASKKNPIKVAQQVQDPHKKALELENAKERMTVAKNGQWSIEKAEPAPKIDTSKYQYHVHQDGQRITTQPMSVPEIDKKYGGLKRLQSTPGIKLMPFKKD